MVAGAVPSLAMVSMVAAAAVVLVSMLSQVFSSSLMQAQIKLVFVPWKLFLV